MHMISLRSPLGRQSRNTVASCSRCECSSYSQTQISRTGERSLPRRRLFQGAISLSVISFLEGAVPALAEEDLIDYEDLSAGFSLSYPSNWTGSEAQSKNKVSVAERTLVWYPEDVLPRDVNVTLLINNAGADYTKLGSFGTVEEFGANLVNSMDRRYLLRGSRLRQMRNDDVQTADLISAKSERGMYSIEYLLKKPNEEAKRLLSLIALRFDGTYNRLYTLTAQCTDTDYAKYQADIQRIMNSFKPPAGKV